MVTRRGHYNDLFLLLLLCGLYFQLSIVDLVGRLLLLDGRRWLLRDL